MDSSHRDKLFSSLNIELNCFQIRINLYIQHIRSIVDKRIIFVILQHQNRIKKESEKIKQIKGTFEYLLKQEYEVIPEWNW